MDNLDDTDSNTKSQGTQTIDVIVPVDNVDSASDVSLDILDVLPRCIHRVPPELRGDRNRADYEPVVLPIGPYHHGKPQFRRGEKFKDEILLRFMAESTTEDETKDQNFFYDEILKSINDIRDSYEYEGVDECTDEVLAGIILRDACLLIVMMQSPVRLWNMMCEHHGIGIATAVLMHSDMWKLENQIPFWVTMQMLYVRFGKEHGQEIVIKFLEGIGRRYCLDSRLPWEDKVECEPLHLLEAKLRTALFKGATTSRETTTCTKNKIWKTKIVDGDGDGDDSRSSLKRISYNPFRSITYLGEKGIYFEPTSTCLMDVKFSSKSCYGILQLPILYLNHSAMVVFSNIITFEMLPRGPIQGRYYFTHYINFMKSLIESSHDVKVLRERGILCSNLGSDEEIVRAFKEINTHRINNFGVFDDVRSQIEKHCNSKAKTWMSDLKHDYFGSPWTVVALFAASFILCLTFLQTYFSIRYPK